VNGTLEARIGQYDSGQGDLNCPFGGVNVAQYRLVSTGLEEVSSHVEDVSGCPKPQPGPPSTGATEGCPLGASLPAQIIATIPVDPPEPSFRSQCPKPTLTRPAIPSFLAIQAATAMSSPCQDNRAAHCGQ
jgi:hypothetical protein